MTWNYFYECQSDWNEDTLIKRISALEDAGTVEEIFDMVSSGWDENTNDLLVRKCISLGAEFTIGDILEFDGLLSEETLNLMIDNAIEHGSEISASDILEFDGIVDEAEMDKLVGYAIDKKASFTADDIVGLDGSVSCEVLDKAAEESWQNFSEDDLLLLRDVIDEDVLERIEDRKWPSDKKQSDNRQKNKGTGLPGLAAGIGFVLNGREHDGSTSFRVGDHVRVKYRGQEGTVIDINGDLIMVSLSDGNHVDSYYAEQLERAF